MKNKGCYQKNDLFGIRFLDDRNSPHIKGSGFIQEFRHYKIVTFLKMEMVGKG